jgi:hypothetical protein
LQRLSRTGNAGFHLRQLEIDGEYRGQRATEVSSERWRLKETEKGAGDRKASEGRLVARSDVAAGARDAPPCCLVGKPFRMGVQKCGGAAE